MDMQRIRTWADISLDSIEHNYRALRAAVPEGTRFLGVVKANAYGHGAVRVAKRLEKLGADYLAVACFYEAVELREAGISLPILILGYSPDALAEQLVDYNITQSVNSLEYAQALQANLAASGKKLRIHLKADSGMGRMGFMTYDKVSHAGEMLQIMAMDCFEVEGIFTHFAVSDSKGDPYTFSQYAEFTALIDELERESGKKFAIRHCANSGAVVNYPELHLDMVRPGLVLYGLYPEKGVTGGIELKPAMQLRTRIAQIRLMPADRSVSYGRTYFTEGERRIAVLPIGYADGFLRAGSNAAEMLLHGKRVRVTGRICMDMCMIDVTDIPEAQVGDVVTIFGEDSGSFISVDEHADRLGTISYELVCELSSRVPRVYDEDAE